MVMWGCGEQGPPPSMTCLLNGRQMGAPSMRTSLPEVVTDHLSGKHHLDWQYCKGGAQASSSNAATGGACPSSQLLFKTRC